MESYSPKGPSLGGQSSEWYRTLRRQLLKWYRRHQRSLPWRDSADPYKVWISEVMLQQTQVATVVPYFVKFVDAFPTAAALAEASEQQVLRHWEGLGYYRRARQMHQAAQVIASRHAGQFPRQFEEIRSLPGIGRYTAGAIASIAFDASTPILEANTVRLFSRLIGYAGDTASRAGQDALWGFAAAVLPSKGAGQLNQSLMELGSQVCAPRAPKCPACPVSGLCVAFQSGRQAELPRPAPRPVIEAVREGSVVIWRGGKVLLRQPPRGERWAGLWDFPRFPLGAERGAMLRQRLIVSASELVGATIEPQHQIATIKHGVTRFRITLDCFSARFVSAKRRRPTDAALKWLRPSQLEAYPLSVTGRKLGRLIAKLENSGVAGASVAGD